MAYSQPSDLLMQEWKNSFEFEHVEPVGSLQHSGTQTRHQTPVGLSVHGAVNMRSVKLVVVTLTRSG